MVDRPLIQHVVDEAREAGIEHFIFVTGRNKGVIEDHFDRQFELEMTLLERQKQKALELIVGGTAGAGHDQLYPPAGAARARPRGVVRARIDRPRAVRAAAAGRARAAPAWLPRADDRSRARSRRAAPISLLSRRCRTIASINTASSASASRRARVFSITSMVEKPRSDRAPSNLILTGRYILQPEIFDILEKQERGAGGEIQLTDAMIAAGAHAAVLRPQIRRPQLRLRLEDRLSCCQRLLCAGERPTSLRVSAPRSRKS